MGSPLGPANQLPTNRHLTPDRIPDYPMTMTTAIDQLHDHDQWYLDRIAQTDMQAACFWLLEYAMSLAAVHVSPTLSAVLSYEAWDEYMGELFEGYLDA